MLDGKAQNSMYGLLYHITPLQGLLNDACGLIKFKNTYHVYYQWNQVGMNHSNKSWGHVYSDDMVHWSRTDPALLPTDWYDKDGVYTGSAIEVEEKLYFFYTGTVINDAGEKESYQCLAISEDGFLFEKKGPVLEHPKGYTRHVRDPKVWKDHNGDFWMIFGAQTLDLNGDTLVYKSRDLYNWELIGSFLEEDVQLGYMWECPNIVQFDNQQMFIFCPQGIEAEQNKFDNIYQSGFLLGNINDSGKFEVMENEFTEFDRGFEFYAPQTFTDGNRTIMYGWMGVMPQEVEETIPTVSEGWLHALTIPRELKIIDGILYQEPIAELKNLRLLRKKVKEEIKSEWHFKSEDPYLELCVDFNEVGDNFIFNFRDSIEIAYNKNGNELILSRINWFSNNKEQRVGKLKEKLSNMHIFLDGSSIEIFVNNGSLVFSSRYFCSHTLESNISFQSNCVNAEITLYPLSL